MSGTGVHLVRHAEVHNPDDDLHVVLDSWVPDLDAATCSGEPQSGALRAASAVSAGSMSTLTFDGGTLIGLDYSEPAADLLVGAVAIK